MGRRPDAPYFCPAFLKAGEKFPKGNAQMAALPPENACKASGLCTRSVVYLYTLCVYWVGGGAPTPREMPRSGAASRFAKPRSFIARAVCCPDRGKLSMQWKVSERERFYVLFASTKRTGSSRRAAALSTPGDSSKLYRIISFVNFRLSSLNWYMVRPAFLDVLNRCERVIAVQTQN